MINELMNNSNKYEEGILVDFMKEHGKRGIELLCDELTAEEARIFDREEGREEGRTEGMEQILKNLLKNGMNPETAAKLAEVPLELVRKIAEELN